VTGTKLRAFQFLFLSREDLRAASTPPPRLDHILVEETDNETGDSFRAQQFWALLHPGTMLLSQVALTDRDTDSSGPVEVRQSRMFGKRWMFLCRSGDSGWQWMPADSVIDRCYSLPSDT
jgi:hypothetical protein